MNNFFLILRYFRYFLKARNEHWLHSPFAFEFYTKIRKAKSTGTDIDKIEALRKNLHTNNLQIEITDFGAGSGISNSRSRSVSSIARHSEKRPALAQFIYRIIKHHKPAVVIDLGTSLGITTLYESMANPSGKVYTFEGCPNTAAIANENFTKLGVKNIDTIIGNIDTTLPSKLAELTSVDFVFFDANHRYEPTIRYFLQCLEKANEDSIFIFDDIYWSEEMQKAWEEIKKHPSVGMSMDLFFLGIIFFRKKQPVQHFTLR